MLNLIRADMMEYRSPDRVTSGTGKKGKLTDSLKTHSRHSIAAD